MNSSVCAYESGVLGSEFRCTFFLSVLAFVFASLMPSTGFAQEPPVGEDYLCEPDDAVMSPARYLRALSLHLRGVVPSEAEYAAAGDSAMVDALLDEWLVTEAFTDQVVRRHRDLLWNNVSNTRVISLQAILGRSRTTSADPYRYWLGNKARTYRGNRVPCDDTPAVINDGVIQYRVDTSGPVPTRIEGYVEVEPYWAPGTMIRVCAFDAQASAVSSSGTDCNSDRSSAEAGCGCGPNLERCADSARDTAIRAAIGQEVSERIRSFFNEDAERAYHELFTEKRAYVNGVLAHYWQHQVYNPNGGMRMVPRPIPVEGFEAIDYADTEWREVSVGEAHSGILTSSAFLLRFQTNRARASRFYDAFLCEPFQPPSGGIPEATDEEAREVDLQKRAGCRYCHAQLEPAASRWGRWVELGGGYLDPVSYPPVREDCRQCALGLLTCSSDCRFNYVTVGLSASQEPFFGMLRSYEFRREDHEDFVEDGPSRLVNEATADGRMSACTARRTAEWLLGRELRAEEMSWIEQLTFDYVQGGTRYRDLVRTIVSSDVYRRVR